IMTNVLSHYSAPQEIEDLMQNYWKEVCIISPVYYLSYATSAVTALNLYKSAITNNDAAYSTYQKLVESKYKNEGFKKALKLTGLPSPFEETAYTSLKNLLRK
ncbi:MAG: hypothetical protein IJC19_06260, partial [Clostridia bacterium]|nr:hypothetical protein [Clostridia bacterium]